MPGKRENVPSWDDTYMSVALDVAKRSKDPRTQVGACIVSQDNRILSVGYNGTPKGLSDDDMPWDSKEKYLYVVHAERNAILNFRGSLKDFSGATLYVTHMCCFECAKEVVQVGISRVVYLEEYLENTPEWKASNNILRMAGVVVEPCPAPYENPRKDT